MRRDLEFYGERGSGCICERQARTRPLAIVDLRAALRCLYGHAVFFCANSGTLLVGAPPPALPSSRPLLEATFIEYMFDIYSIFTSTYTYLNLFTFANVRHSDDS